MGEIKEKTKGDCSIPQGSKEYLLKKRVKGFFDDKTVCVDFDTIVLLLDFKGYRARNHEQNHLILEYITNLIGARLHKVKYTDGTNYKITETTVIQKQVIDIYRIKKGKSITKRFHTGYTGIWLIEYQGVYIPVESHSKRSGITFNIFGLNQYKDAFKRSVHKRELVEILTTIDDIEEKYTSSHIRGLKLDWYIYKYDLAFDIKMKWDDFVDDFFLSFKDMLIHTEGKALRKRKALYDFFYGDIILTLDEVKKRGSCYFKPYHTGRKKGNKYIVSMKTGVKRKIQQNTIFKAYDKTRKYNCSSKDKGSLDYDIVRLEKTHTFNDKIKLTVSDLSKEVHERLFRGIKSNVTEEVKMNRMFYVGGGMLKKMLYLIRNYNIGSLLHGGYKGKY